MVNFVGPPVYTGVAPFLPIFIVTQVSDSMSGLFLSLCFFSLIWFSVLVRFKYIEGLNKIVTFIFLHVGVGING